MFDFILGIAIGSAFAPVWMKLWAIVKEKGLVLIDKYSKN